MDDLTIPTVDLPEITSEPEIVIPTIVPRASSLSFKDRLPSNFAITAVEEGIEAINHASGDYFIGSIADFNALIKNVNA